MQFVSSDILTLSPDMESFPEDDIDRVFKKLEKLEPPKDIIKQILANVKQLPASQRHPRSSAPSDSWLEGQEEASD